MGCPGLQGSEDEGREWPGSPWLVGTGVPIAASRLWGGLRMDAGPCSHRYLCHRGGPAGRGLGGAEPGGVPEGWGEARLQAARCCRATPGLRAHAGYATATHITTGMGRGAEPAGQARSTVPHACSLTFTPQTSPGSQAPSAGWGTCQPMPLTKSGHPGMSPSRYRRAQAGTPGGSSCRVGTALVSIPPAPPAQGPGDLPWGPHL